MSFEAMKWASEQKAGNSTNKCILWILANYADQDFTCFPSIKKIANMAECSESTARRSLHDLRKKSLIEIRERYQAYGDKNRQTSNVYVLKVDCQIDTHPPVKLTPTPLSKQTGDITSHINQSINTIGTSTNATDDYTIAKFKNLSIYSEAFEEFWSAYPRRPNSSKKDAFNKFKSAIKKISQTKLMHATKQFASSQKNTDPKFIPHASTGVNQERYFDILEEPKQKTNRNRIAG